MEGERGKHHRVGHDLDPLAVLRDGLDSGGPLAALVREYADHFGLGVESGSGHPSLGEMNRLRVGECADGAARIAPAIPDARRPAPESTRGHR